MKILLINPSCGPRTIGLRNIARIEPLGLELVGAGVSREHDVRLVDMEVRQEDLAETLAEFKPDVAGVTSEIVHVETALEALRDVRRAAPDCLTVVGGHHPTLCPQDFDDPVVNLIVLGEGVQAFQEICMAAGNGGNYDGIAGIMIRTDSGLKLTSARAMPVTLDDQPAPDRSLTEKYRSAYFYMLEDSVAAVRTSAGCSFPCIFCSCRVYSQGKFIPRSPELVFEEIKSLDEEFIMFCDDHSFHDPERMRILGEMLLAAGVKKRYFAYGRADSIVENPDVYALWAKAGLSLVMVGLEAIDEAALKRTGKRTSTSVNDEAVEILGRLGVGLSAGFLVEPHFGPADFKLIDDYIKVRPSILLAEFTPLTPFPGTVLHRKTKDTLLTEDRQVYDLQHFLMATRLAPQELYRMMLRSYRQVIFRMILKLRLWRPNILFSKRGRRVLAGLARNHIAFLRAHKDVPQPVCESHPDPQGAASP
ncbi:MAG: radical SAM protein [Rhodobacteraceae bacterium]|nr:radical SAM protein [Paracoccaceae bacterium]